MPAGSRKLRLRFGLSLTRRVNENWRPARGLLHPGKQIPKMKAGIPDYPHDKDSVKLQAEVLAENPTAMPKSQRRFQSIRNLPKLRNDWNLSNCHEMQGKFRFSIEGRFNDEVLERDIYKAANELCLLGWVKVRKKFASGHLQGDVYSLSAMQKFLKERHWSVNAAEKIYSDCLISDENFGIPEPLQFKQLLALKDWRAPLKKRLHKKQLEGGAKLNELNSESADRRQIMDEESCRLEDLSWR